MAGLDPAISLRDALYPPKRDHRDKPGDDKHNMLRALSLTDLVVKQPTLRRPYSLRRGTRLLPFFRPSNEGMERREAPERWRSALWQALREPAARLRPFLVTLGDRLRVARAQ